MSAALVSRRAAPLALALLTLLWLNTCARAAGLYRDGVGAAAQALAGSGTAFAADPLDALFANPAALGESRAAVIALGPEGGFVRGNFRNRANPRGAELRDAGVVGALAAVAPPLGPLRFALGVNPDIALRGRWHYRDAPGGADGATSYGLQPHGSEILLLRTALGVSWELAPTLTLGASVGLLYNYNHLHAPYIFQTQPALRTVKTRLDLETDGFGWNAQAGLLWRPHRALRLGLTYTTQSRVNTDGRATGNADVQLARLGLGGARPDFAYDAAVANVFPRQVSAGLAWQATPRLTLGAQLDWLNWADAFDTLPVRLRHGNNADLNALVGADRLDDRVPLRWRDQFVARAGVEYALDPRWTLRAGYLYGRDPVPAETLTPLTAALTAHTLTSGVGYHAGRWTFDLAHQWAIPATGRVNESALAAGEYSASRVRVSTQWLALTTAVGF